MSKRDTRQVVRNLHEQLLHLDVTAEPGQYLGSIRVKAEDVELLRQAIPQASATIYVTTDVPVTLDGHYINGRFVVAGWAVDSSAIDIRAADVELAIREEIGNVVLEVTLDSQDLMPARHIHFEGRDL